MNTCFGLTGGIASGKSTVSAVFAEEGVAVIDGDLVARAVVRPGQPGLQAVIEAFGERFLATDGTLDRKALGAHVFASPAELGRLDETLGPHIFAEIEARAMEARDLGWLACVDAALLVEKGLHEHFRPLVVVTAPLAMQVARVMTRDRLSEPEARARIASQLPTEAKVRVADYLIVNDGSVDALRSRALDVLSAIKTR